MHAYAINYVGLILTVESAFTLGRLRFSNANLVTVFVLLGYVFVCIAIQGRHHSQETFLPFLNNFLYLTSAAIIGVATGYLLELFLRRDFIQRLIIMHERKKVEEEKQKSEHLLGSILPAKIVGRLKDGATCIADGYSDVSVLFLDIANFTPLATKTNALSCCARLPFPDCSTVCSVSARSVVSVPCGRGDNPPAR